jgi:hypothetical protein
MMRGTGAGLLVACAVGLVLQAGCAAKPRERPLNIGPVDTGPGSLEATRRALQGTWTLVSLDVLDASGARQPVKATGRLTYDAYGNMTISGTIENDPVKTPALLEFKGRIVIDTARKQFYAADLVAGQPVDAAQLAPVSADKARRYELTSDSLTVTYMDAAGRPTATASWRRAGS